MLEERRKTKWKKFTGINENNRIGNVEYSNHFKFLNFSDGEKWTLMRSTNDSQPEINQEAEAAASLEPKNNAYNVWYKDDFVFDKSIFYSFFNVPSVILHSLSRKCFTLIKSTFFTSISRSVVTYITLTVTNISNNNNSILQYNENVQSSSYCQKETV